MDESQRAPIVTGDVAEIRRRVDAARRGGQSIGFVPTMGALHAGHRSLIEAARAECDVVVVSIFVNPTQFAPNEDLDKYPRTEAADIEMCRQAGVAAVFMPVRDHLYPEGYCSYVTVENLSTVLEGKYRPTHFRGVTTIVLKLLNIVAPDIAFFGQKDYQQQLILRRMCIDLDVPVEIRTCATVREPDGLAMSSRNRYLDDEQRRAALALSRGLQKAKILLEQGEGSIADARAAMQSELTSTPRIEIDYATIVDPDSLAELSGPQRHMVALVAAKVDAVRLIDNTLITLDE